MALKKSITTESLVHVADAYHRVEGITHPSKSSMTFHVRSYVMKDAPDGGFGSEKMPHDTFFREMVIGCDFAIGGKSAWDQAYDHLKTLPEFADAVNC